MPEAKPIWSVYLIQCDNGSLYCGITTDIARRFSEHQSQGPKCAKYLRGKSPLKLVYQAAVGDRSAATKEELRIKSLGRKDKLKLIKRA